MATRWYDLTYETYEGRICHQEMLGHDTTDDELGTGLPGLDGETLADRLRTMVQGIPEIDDQENLSALMQTYPDRAEVRVRIDSEDEDEEDDEYPLLVMYHDEFDGTWTISFEIIKLGLKPEDIPTSGAPDEAEA